MTHLQTLQRRSQKTKKKLFDTGLLSFAQFFPLFTLSAVLIASLQLFQDTGIYGYVRAEFPLLSPAIDTLMQEKYTTPIKMPDTTWTLEHTSTTLSLRSLQAATPFRTVPYTASSLSKALHTLLAQITPSTDTQPLIVLVPSADRPLIEIVQLIAQLRTQHHYAHVILAHHASKGIGDSP